MDVTFVLEESGVTVTVEVPCEADVAAAKEVACTALAVSPASVEMRIGTQVLEGTCRLQDTAFDAGVQVVLARRFADIKCPAAFCVDESMEFFVSLSCCGTLCLYYDRWHECLVGFDTETFGTSFQLVVGMHRGRPCISQCRTHCYVAYDGIRKIALPGGEELRGVGTNSSAVFACGGVVVSQGEDGVSVYDEDLTLLRSLSLEGCQRIAVSDCGEWVIGTSRENNNVCLWDVKTGEAVVCVSLGWRCEAVALSRSASVFAVGGYEGVDLYDWSGVQLHEKRVVCRDVEGLQFTPCGKYLVVHVVSQAWRDEFELHQYDMTTMSRVLVIPCVGLSFAVSPCSRVVVFGSMSHEVVTRHLYPHNSE